MSSVQNPDADREDYVVSVLEFAGDQGAATAALQRVFGLTEADARTILKEVPVAVRRGVNRIRAEYFRRALELSGARVEVRDGEGAVVSAASAAAREQSSVTLSARAQPSGPMNARGGQPSGPLQTRPRRNEATTARAQLSGPMTGVQSRPVSQPMAAGAVSQPHVGKTIAFGSPAANDTATAKPGGWGEFQPFKAATAKPAAPKQDPQPPLPPPDATMSTAPSADQEWALSLEAEAGPLDSPLGSPVADHALELASLPSPAGPPKKYRVEEPPALEINSDAQPSGAALELDVEQPRPREPAPRYDAIPAGQHWRAPGADTFVKARRKQSAEALESGFGDAPPPPNPRPVAPAVARPGPTASPATARGPLASPPIARQRNSPSSRLELGVWEAVQLGFSGTAFSWIVKIAGASVVLAGLAQLSVRIPALGLPLLLVGLTCVLGLCAEYHRHVFWAAATREKSLSERPALSISNLMRDGVHLTALALLTQGFVWFWLAGQLSAGTRPLAIVCSPTLWVLGFAPGFYWPIALACAAAKNRSSGVWDFALGLRVLGRAPAEVALVVLATAASFQLTLLIAAAVVNATSLDPSLAFVTAAGIPIAISHAFAGALMGRVVHGRPDLFE